MTKTTLAPRKQRRLDARQTGAVFQPQYSSGVRHDEKGSKFTVGGAPETHEEATGIGYERFNNKYVSIAEVAAE